MANIHGRPGIAAAGYFHDPGDVQKTATALRATYNPSLSNRITNAFARQERPKLAKFVNGFRNLDLSLREAVNGRRQDKARKQFAALAGDDNASTEDLQAAARRLDHLEHKAGRLDTKRTLGETARAGALDEGVQLANEGLQEKLLQEGYVPLAGLRDVPHDRVPSPYLVSGEDGHRIKIHSERPPLLARMIANSVSDGYDRGSSGAGRAARSTLQHALVGVYSAEQSIKGMGARALAGSGWLDKGASARMDLRGARTVQKRHLLQASFGGNVTLNDAFEQVRGQQTAHAEAYEDAAPDEYARHGAPNGVRPLQTRFWQRRVDAFYSRHSGDGPPPGAAPDAIARFAVGVANLRAKASKSVYASRQQRAEAKAQASEDSDVRDRYVAKASRYGANADKWGQQVSRNRSALQGRLLDTLRGTEKASPASSEVSFDSDRDE